MNLKNNKTIKLVLLCLKKLFQNKSCLKFKNNCPTQILKLNIIIKSQNKRMNQELIYNFSWITYNYHILKTKNNMNKKQSSLKI